MRDGKILLQGVGYFTVSELAEIACRRESEEDRRETGSELRGVPRRESERNEKIRATFDAIADRGDEREAARELRRAIKASFGR